MPGESKNGMQCTEFESLLIEALDESLTGARLESFQNHARTCATCGPLMAEADAGRRWLRSLTEVEPPANLVHNILVATSGVESKPSRSLAGRQTSSWKDKVTGWMRPVLGVALQPRFAMSFGMAFFSLSVALSVAGVKVGDLRHADLRPAAIKRSYYETSGRVVKYYENIRLVYVIESRVQQFKRATTPAEPVRQEENKQRKNDDTSGQPEQKQERNYSQAQDQPVLASVPNDPPVVTVTTYRRLV